MAAAPPGKPKASCDDPSCTVDHSHGGAEHDHSHGHDHGHGHKEHASHDHGWVKLAVTRLSVVLETYRYMLICSADLW